MEDMQGSSSTKAAPTFTGVCFWKLDNQQPCQLAFTDPEAFRIHIVEEHVGRKSSSEFPLSLNCRWIGCSHAQKPFSKRDHIASHCRSHVTFKAYICPDCNVQFKWPHDLKKHCLTKEHTFPDMPAKGAFSAIPGRTRPAKSRSLRGASTHSRTQSIKEETLDFTGSDVSSSSASTPASLHQLSSTEAEILEDFDRMFSKMDQQLEPSLEFDSFSSFDQFSPSHYTPLPPLTSYPSDLHLNTLATSSPNVMEGTPRHLQAAANVLATTPSFNMEGMASTPNFNNLSLTPPTPNSSIGLINQQLMNGQVTPNFGHPNSSSSSYPTPSFASSFPPAPPQQQLLRGSSLNSPISPNVTLAEANYHFFQQAKLIDQLIRSQSNYGSVSGKSASSVPQPSTRKSTRASSGTQQQQQMYHQPFLQPNILPMHFTQLLQQHMPYAPVIAQQSYENHPLLQQHHQQPLSWIGVPMMQEPESFSNDKTC
ncbi:UNVERIFIED_CONTAM: hypothetical protein HDU68_000835 [Siphonaria sp. JEL0065]|nr:hypothetical protein HDU68_000835 [Siphonaria sp. JEL0065]